MPVYAQTQIDTYKLLSDMAARQMQDDARNANVDETLANIQVVLLTDAPLIKCRKGNDNLESSLI